MIGIPTAAVPVAELEAVDDIEWAARLLAATPTHEQRDPRLLRRWARAADAFGAGLAPRPYPVRIVERQGGLESGLVARYVSKPATLELYTDTIALAERIIGACGWRGWYPPGSVRAAALAHETAHAHLHHGTGRNELKHALGHTALRLGRLRVAGHVAGAEEVAAHAYARAACGLGRSPLLLTAALAAAVAPAEAVAPARREK